MRSFKHIVKLLYFFFRFLFYPVVLVLTMAVPGSPQRIVGIFTLFFIGFLSNFVWNNTPVGISLFVLMQITGIGLAILFMIWGADFEENPLFRTKR